MATTNTEVYRRFEGTLRTHPFRFLPLTLAAIRTLTKRKMPLILLYGPPLITTIVMCSMVYLNFSLSTLSGGGSSGSMTIGLAEQLLETRGLIEQFVHTMGIFVLLIIAWFGSGLIAEDRRYNAHLLYFARPLTKFDYFLGKFGVTLFFGLLVTLLPFLLICLMASIASPDWAFAKEETDVFGACFVFGLIWTVVLSLFVLAVSSLVKKRTHALLGIFGAGMLLAMLKEIALDVTTQDTRLKLISPLDNLVLLSEWIFEKNRPALEGDPAYALAALGAMSLAAFAVIMSRLRRMEVQG